MSEIIGSLERRTGGFFVYKDYNSYVVYRAQGMLFRVRMHLDINIWQSQLHIWLVANGY